MNKVEEFILAVLTVLLFVTAGVLFAHGVITHTVHTALAGIVCAVCGWLTDLSTRALVSKDRFGVTYTTSNTLRHAEVNR